MFTVIISEKQHLDTIKDNNLILGPILDSDTIGFCEWDPNEDGFEKMVPDLWKTLEGKDSWRGIVIIPEDGLKEKNPFDYVIRNNDGSNHALDVARKNPLSRLSTFLFDNPLSYEGTDGFSDKIKEKEDTNDEELTEEPNQTNEVTNADTIQSESAVNEDTDQTEEVSTEDSSDEKVDSFAKREEFEILKQYYEFAEKKSEVRKSILGDWEKSILAPIELICISLRTHNELEETIATSWEGHVEHQYSTFCDRNLYYDPMRFLVFDIHPKRNSLYNLEYLRFLYSVVLIAGNKLPMDSLRSQRLYKIEAKDDIKEIKRLIVSYEEKLSNTESLLEEEATRIELQNKGELTENEVESLYCSDANIPVIPDSEVKESSLYADWSVLGLARDCAMNENAWWYGAYKNTCDLLRKYIKVPMRAVRKGVGILRESNIPNLDDVKKLSKYQIEDITEYVGESEEKMISVPNHTIGTMEEYEKRLEKTSEALKKEMGLRMNLPLTLGLGIGLILVFVLGFMPLLTSNLARFGTRIVALFFIAIFVLMFVAVQLGALFYFRGRVRARIGDFNATIRDIISDMKRSMALRSEYLSHMCSVMRGKAVLNFYHDEEEVGAYAARIRRKHADEIHKKREDLGLTFGVYLNDKSYVDEKLTEPYRYNFAHTAEYDYPLPLIEGDERKVEFMQYGNYISVPFAFVNYLMATLEELYD